MESKYKIMIHASDYSWLVLNDENISVSKKGKNDYKTEDVSKHQEVIKRFLSELNQKIWPESDKYYLHISDDNKIEIITTSKQSPIERKNEGTKVSILDSLNEAIDSENTGVSTVNDEDSTQKIKMGNVVGVIRQKAYRIKEKGKEKGEAA